MSCNVTIAFIAMMTGRIDASLPFTLKKEQNVCNDNDSDVNLDNIDDFSSVFLPSLSKNNSVIVDESNNEFLRLTAMARFLARARACVCMHMHTHTFFFKKDHKKLSLLSPRNLTKKLNLYIVLYIYIS